MRCEPNLTPELERTPLDLPERVPALNSYYVYLTMGCNLACKHCWLSPPFQRNGGTGGHLDYDLFALAVDEGLLLGLRHVKLTGGEPLLHPEFEKIVKLIKEKGLGLTIETNGTLLTQSLARFLKDESSLGHISVSLDGAIPETHDPFRGVQGSFEKAVQGIRHLVEVGYRPQVIMSLHPGSVDEMESLVRLAEELGAGSLKFNIIQPSGRGELMVERGQVLDIRRLIELGKWVEDDLQKQTAIRLYYSWPLAFYSLKHLLAIDGYSCGIFSILGILPTGHMAMCGIGSQVPELCYGLFGQDHVADVWAFHPMLINLRERLPIDLEGICAKCILRNRCLGMCVAENYQIHGRLTAPYWFCQNANDVGLFPISRR